MEMPCKPVPGPSRLAWQRFITACSLAAGLTLGCGPGVSKPAGPTITDFNPKSGTFATPVTVTGSGFSTGVSVLNVFVGGVDTGVGTLTSDSSLTFTVPDSAVSGPVKVVTDGGTAVSIVSFSVVPTVTGLTTVPASAGTPAAAQAGTPVTIAGHALLAITRITMNAAGGGVLTLTPVSQTADQIIFTVPGNAAASNVITLDYGLASQQILFNVTP